MAAGLILAAPASGSGKTTVTLALLRHLARSGLSVAGAKTGPDYIDPSFHLAACRRPSINLDPWAMRRETIVTLIAGLDAGLVLCEGVMGLFDGAGSNGDLGSTADLASLTGWPVVLVVDARGQSASVAALLEGFARHRTGLSLAGVIFNRVGSERHGEMLRNAASRALPELAILGMIPRNDALKLPSRHLGLVLADEIKELDSFLNHAADIIGSSIDVARLASLARPSALAGRNRAVVLPPLGGRIALARDAAFAFVYPHLIDGWRRQGAEILPFSPLMDEAPDTTADAIFLPGGYPELHAGRLAEAERFQDGLRKAAKGGAVIYGECGGYMALGSALIDKDGSSHRMAGLLPIVTSIAKPKRRLGYRHAVALGGPWQGLNCRGHEFHFAELIESQDIPPLWTLADADGKKLGAAGHVLGQVSGSFFHVIDQDDPKER